MSDNGRKPLSYAYYPGCSLHSTASEYQDSTRAVCNALDIELVEIPDWNCCGASSGHGTDHILSTSLAARNLVLAQEMNLDVAIPCAACYNRLASASHELAENPELKKAVDPLLPAPYDCSVRVRPLVDVIVTDAGLDAIKEKVTRPLENLNVACYYGCLLVRPPKVLNFDRAEDPQILDDLVTSLGAASVDWPHKTECCGASFSLTRTDIVHKLTGDILKMAKASGANCVVCACPLCMANLDMRQSEIERLTGEKIDLPIFYFTELIGLAMDISAADGWLKKHFVNPAPLLKQAVTA